MHGFRKSAHYALFELKRFFLNRLLLGSYALDGEDLLIDELTGKKSQGFYVDVGACHPTRFSNTMMFYKRGWRGLNVEANSALLAAFTKSRARDITVNYGVGGNEGSRELYVMYPPTVSTFSQEFRDLNVSRGCEFLRTEKVEFLRLASVLERHLPSGAEIDFLSMDTEGLDFEVLQSNDWTKYQPKVICVETPSRSLPDGVQSTNLALHSYLHSHGYDLVHYNGLDAFFLRRN